MICNRVNAKPLRCLYTLMLQVPMAEVKYTYIKTERYTSYIHTRDRVLCCDKRQKNKIKEACVCACVVFKSMCASERESQRGEGIESLVRHQSGNEIAHIIKDNAYVDRFQPRAFIIIRGSDEFVVYLNRFDISMARPSASDTNINELPFQNR